MLYQAWKKPYQAVETTNDKHICNQHWIREDGVQVSHFLSLIVGFSTNNIMISLLLKALGPNFPKLVFMPQTPNVKGLGSLFFFFLFFFFFFFHVKLNKILYQISPYFQILNYFWQSYECLFPENCKKVSKNLFYGAISDVSISSKFCLEKPRFLEL